jgi:hypothetical protein
VNGHHGIGRTIRALKENGSTWPGMRKDVVEFIRGCRVCQKSRVTVKECIATDCHVIESFDPLISIDYMVNLPKEIEGYENILVTVLNFSKFVELFPVKTMGAVSTAKCLVQVLSIMSEIGVQTLLGKSARSCWRSYPLVSVHKQMLLLNQSMVRSRDICKILSMRRTGRTGGLQRCR